ncbi:hypothetical protein [Chromobacterium violaceum]
MLHGIGVRNRFSGAFSFPAIQNRMRRAMQLRPAPMGRCSSTRKRPRGGYGTARRVCVFLALYAFCIFVVAIFYRTLASQDRISCQISSANLLDLVNHLKHLALDGLPFQLKLYKMN